MDYEFLRRFLKENKITRAEFAKALDVPIFTVHNWFRRKPKNFPVEMAVKIASRYHIMLDDLIGGEAAASWFMNSMIGDKVEDDNEARIMLRFRKLNLPGQEKVIDYADTLSKVPEYQAKPEGNEKSDD